MVKPDKENKMYTMQHVMAAENAKDKDVVPFDLIKDYIVVKNAPLSQKVEELFKSRKR